MQELENTKCLKCFSQNPLSVYYCRYCHERLAHFKKAELTESNQEGRHTNKKLIIAASTLTVLVAGYFIFKQ